MSKIQIPIALHAEQNVLAISIMKGTGFEECLETGISVEDFTNEQNQIIWKSLTRLHNNEEVINLPSLVSDLEKYHELKTPYLNTNKISGVVDINYITNNIADLSVYSGEDVSVYAKRIKDATYRRKLMQTSQNILMDGSNPELHAKDYLEKAEKAILDFSENNNVALGDNQSDSVLDYLNHSFEKDLKDFSDIQLRTGFEYLDRLLGGHLYPGMYTLAATSSLGKTTLVSQIADNIAEAQTPVLYFSIEMSQMELVSKSLARLVAKQPGNIKLSSLDIRKRWHPNMDINDSLLSLEEFSAIEKAYETYKRKIAPNMYVAGANFDCTVDAIISKINRFIRVHGQKPFVVVDYLQIIQKEKDFRGTDQQHIDACVTALERYAKKQQITIFVISSVNRQSYLTPISFESLKASGSIEFSSDVVIAMDLLAISETEKDATDITERRKLIDSERKAIPRRIALKTLKNRYGCGGETYFVYNPVKELFRNTDKKPPKPEEAENNLLAGRYN